jgi:hypothetical protein
MGYSGFSGWSGCANPTGTGGSTSKSGSRGIDGTDLLSHMASKSLYMTTSAATAQQATYYLATNIGTT